MKKVELNQNIFKIMKKIRNLAIRIASFAAPLSVFAQSGPGTAVTPPTVPTSDTEFTLNQGWARIDVFVNWVVALVGVASVVFLMYGAYLYMSSGQNEENLKKAKTSLIYGIIGAVVAVLAFSIFSFASSLVG